MIRGARLRGQADLQDIAVADGCIAAVSPRLSDPARQTIEAAGRLVTPPFVESHVHLDTALTAGEPRWNESGTLFEGIQCWSERKESLTYEDVRRRATTALKWQAAQGILHVRTHVDTTDPELTALKALIDVRHAVRDWINVQIVAFPQEGIHSFPGGAELLEEALRMGADVVGGIPHYELTRELGVQSVQTTFDLAAKYDKPIDVHCDEIDDPQSRFVEVMAAEAIRRDMGDRVAASHTTAFHSYDNAYAYKLMGFLRRAQMHFVANPLVNITLQGRMDTYPKRRGITRVKELLANGINVCTGHDDILDPWYSLGTGSLLQVAFMTVHACHMTGRAEVAACFDMVTERAARVLGLGSHYGIALGRPADLVMLDATDEHDAIRRLAPVLAVVKGGRLIAETSPTQTRLLVGPEPETVTFQR